MLIGVGGFDVKKVKEHYAFHDTNISSEMVNITEPVAKEAKNVNAISIWITKEWEESWYDAKIVQKEIVDKGYTPVFIFYWFGDEVSVKYIQKNKKHYFDTLKKFTKYLKKIDGQKIVVLNPEYNMFGVEKWEGMNDIFLKSFSIVRNDPQTLVGPCVGDFGNYNYENEPKEWALFNKSLYKAAPSADFIAFQEMRALTRNTKQEILSTPQRALYLSKYLYEKYNKPTLLAYVAISTYGDEGKLIQAEVYKRFLTTLPLMQEQAQLLYFGLFHYFDYPGHIGYFNAAEEYFGVLDSNGSMKPSFKYFKQLQ
jgi:hypothetical protein